MHLPAHIRGVGLVNAEQFFQLRHESLIAHPIERASEKLSPGIFGALLFGPACEINVAPPTQCQRPVRQPNLLNQFLPLSVSEGVY
ncbi:protein of unknown function [Caballeronia sp. S22]